MPTPLPLGFTERDALRRYATTRIDDLRESLEALAVEPRMADYYRGRIAELKELIEQLN